MLGRRAPRRLAWIVVIAALSLFSRAANAYPWMIRHQYQGCVPCHADPSGAGLLTEYGRAQGDIILRMRYGVPPPEDAPSSSARFLWGVPTPEWLLLGGSVRNGVQIKKAPDADLDTRFLQMQADLRAQVTFGRFRAYGGLGYMHEGARPTQVTTRDDNNLVSREHWIGFDLGADNQFLLRAGRIALPFGIRSNEHELFVRSTHVLRTNINESQQHGVAFAYNSENTRGEIMAILGNYQLSSDSFRERGYSGYLELSVSPSVSVGASSMLTYAKRDFFYLTPETLRQAHGAFTRIAPFESLVILAEADGYFVTTDNGDDGTSTSKGLVAMLQADIEPTQGLHLVATGEAWIADDLQIAPGAPPIAGKSFSGGAAAVWFFAPHADFRFDFVASSVLDGPTTIYLLPQLHIYL